MQTLIHSSPLGALSIAGVDGDIEPGVPFHVDDDTADLLLEQGDIFTLSVEAGPYDGLKLAELKEIAGDLPVTGKTRAAYIDALNTRDAAAIANTTSGEIE
jgi:hypothetical protein